MPSDHTKQVTPETLGDGVYDPRDFRVFSDEGASVVRMYHEDPDASLVVWNLNPGQEHSLHRHPENLHVFYVLEGEGIYLRGDLDPVPVAAGQCLIIPRTLEHGIRNTGSIPMAYLAFSTYSAKGFTRETRS
jgi:mannose-6-phosphate isomerase-like protein (cupin superfamily)